MTYINCTHCSKTLSIYIYIRFAQMYITSFPNYRKIKRHADRPGSLVSSFLLISEWSRSSLVFFFLGGATAVQRRRAFLLCMVPCARIWRVTARQRIALLFLVFIWAWLQQPCDNSIFFFCVCRHF
jgi:hypothetical protein